MATPGGLGFGRIIGQEKSVRRLQRDGTTSLLWEHFERSLGFYSYAVPRIIEKHGDYKTDPFWEAYSWLAAKCLSNFRSIGLLVDHGWHGSAYALLRSMYVDTAMLWYLHFRPDLIEKWLNESETEYRDSREFYNNFNEKAMFKMLGTKGIGHTLDTFRWFSKSAHASGWGVRFFAQDGRLAFGPFESLEHMNMLLAPASGFAQGVIEVAWVHSQSKADSEMCSLAAESHAIACESSVFTAALIALTDMAEHMHEPSEPAQGP